LGKAEQEIRRVALETLGEISVQWSDYFLTGHASNFSFDFFSQSISEGHQRAIMGSMTVEVTYPFYWLIIFKKRSLERLTFPFRWHGAVRKEVLFELRKIQSVRFLAKLILSGVLDNSE
jgi:hypothetical protein